MSEWKESQGNTWVPEEAGDEIVGLLVEVEKDVGPNNSILYSVQTSGPDGETYGVWGSTILDSRMKAVRIGEEVKIIFDGMSEKASPGKNPPKLFRVFHREPDALADTIKKQKVQRSTSVAAVKGDIVEEEDDAVAEAEKALESARKRAAAAKANAS